MLTVIADLDASTVDGPGLTDSHSGSIFNTPATRLEDGFEAWNLDRGFFRFTGGPRWLVAQSYTHCSWVKWRDDNFGWRTIFHGSHDHSTFVQNMGEELGVFSNRKGGFRGSGYKIVKGSFQFVCAVGKGQHSHSAEGETQFYVGSASQAPVPVGNVCDRVVSGTHVNSIGWPGQGPGKVHRFTAFNYALTEDKLKEFWSKSKPAGFRAACENPKHRTLPDCTQGKSGVCHGRVRLGLRDRWSDWKDVDGEFDCTNAA